MIKKRHFLLIPCLVAVFAVSVSAGIGAITSATANNGWSESQVAPEYDYNETLIVRDRTYTFGNDSVVATTVVCYPDGTTSADKEIKLDQAGIYTVKYTAQVGGKVYADSEQFLVNYPAYFVSNGKSSVSYGTPDRAQTKGVMARIAQGDRLEFTQYIDFSQVTMDQYLVKGFVTPDVPGTMDFTELILTFTDSVDSSIYFQVHYYGYDWAWNTYVAAGGQNQQPVGLHQTEGLKTGNGYGHWSYVPLNSKGQVADKSIGVLAPDASQFFVAMNYAEKQVYCPGFVSSSDMFADLDDTTDADGSIKFVDNAWTGFPSGKARLSVSANGLTGATANLCITEVFGIPAEDLGANIYLDEEKPAVMVDEAYAEQMPIGLVGYDYTVPKATAYDAYAYDCAVEVKVWYNYGLDGAVNIPVKNGKFAIDKAGTYVIEYIARDRVGNVVSTQKWVRAFDEIADANFEIPSEKTTSAHAGEWLEVPVITGKDVTGGSGVSTVAIYAEFNGQRELIVGGGFRPMNVGTYKVVYVATDYVGKSVEKSYDVTVTANSQPILERNFDLYPVYISGQSYALPEYYAYVYNGNKLERTLCDVVVTDASGVNAYKAGDRATITVANNGDKVGFTVQCNGVTLASHESIGALAWVQEEVGRRFHVENYLSGEGFTVEKTQKDGMVVTATQANYGFTFANALSAKQVEMKLGNLVGATSDTKLYVTLMDVLDNDKSVTITLSGNSANTYVSANGVTKTLKATPFGTSVYTVLFESGVFTVNGESIDVSNIVDFETDKVFLSVSVVNAEDTGFTMYEMGNCRFSTDVTDRVAPVLFSQYETGGMFKPGTIYTIKAPVCYDVYSPNMIYTLTVEDPDGNPITDVNGVLLQNVDPTKDYVIELSSIGQYFVKYEASEDTAFAPRPNKTPLTYALMVVDEVAPTITWNGSFPAEAKVGDMVVVPGYTVSDNHSKAENVVVLFFVETPADQLIMLPGNSIKVNHAGVYEFRVMVVDEVGNVTNEIYYVTVTA